jgi:hypothetical protein
MTTFLFVYRVPEDHADTPRNVGETWREWFAGLGPSLVEIGDPVFRRQTIGKAAPTSPLGGYSVVEAADLDAAIELARGCPILTVGGGVEIGELTPNTAS